jgi:hypothetical protein
MAREKLSDKVARLERELASAQYETAATQRLLASKREALDKLLQECEGATRPDGILRRVASIICNADQDPATYSWDDVCQTVEGREYERTELRTILGNTSARLQLGINLQNSTEAEIMDKVDTEICKLQEAKETVDSLPTGWEEWKDLMSSSLEPAEVERMIELLELLGLEGKKLAYVLQSTDLTIGIEHAFYK